MSTIQSYLAPPRGCRSRVWQFYRRWRTRNKEEGPYELFITYTLERVYAIPDDLLESARLKWLAAETDINSILWGTIEQRKAAKQNLESLNSREFDDTGVGCIEVENWFNAGHQLEKAVRDYHIYGSTAVRFHLLDSGTLILILIAFRRCSGFHMGTYTEHEISNRLEG